MLLPVVALVAAGVEAVAGASGPLVEQGGAKKGGRHSDMAYCSKMEMPHTPAATPNPISSGLMGWGGVS